ncbi:hypothetical protein GVAV_002306 [Gurleya vavrai]
MIDIWFFLNPVNINFKVKAAKNEIHIDKSKGCKTVTSHELNIIEKEPKNLTGINRPVTNLLQNEQISHVMNHKLNGQYKFLSKKRQRTDTLTVSDAKYIDSFYAFCNNQKIQILDPKLQKVNSETNLAVQVNDINNFADKLTSNLLQTECTFSKDSPNKLDHMEELKKEEFLSGIKNVFLRKKIASHLNNFNFQIGTKKIKNQILSILEDNNKSMNNKQKQSFRVNFLHQHICKCFLLLDLNPDVLFKLENCDVLHNFYIYMTELYDVKILNLLFDLKYCDAFKKLKNCEMSIFSRFNNSSDPQFVTNNSCVCCLNNNENFCDNKILKIIYDCETKNKNKYFEKLKYYLKNCDQDENLIKDSIRIFYEFELKNNLLIYEKFVEWKKSKIENGQMSVYSKKNFTSKKQNITDFVVKKTLETKNQSVKKIFFQNYKYTSLMYYLIIQSALKTAIFLLKLLTK